MIVDSVDTIFTSILPILVAHPNTQRDNKGLQLL